MKYPKLTLLLGTFVLAYILHHLGFFDRFSHYLNGHGYFSMLLGGALFSFGFTAAFGIALIIDVAVNVDPMIGALVAGIGATFVDTVLFSLVRFTVFHEEIHALRTSRVFVMIHRFLHRESVSERVRRMILWSVAGLVIASPLPDEFGVTLISSVSSMQKRDFVGFCFILNTLGILAIILGTRIALG